MANLKSGGETDVDTEESTLEISNHEFELLEMEKLRTITEEALVVDGSCVQLDLARRGIQKLPPEFLPQLSSITQLYLEGNVFPIQNTFVLV